MWQCKRQNKTILKGLSGFKTSSSFIIKIVLNCHKNRQRDQWKKIEPRNSYTPIWKTDFWQRQDQFSGEWMAFQQTVLELLAMLMPKWKQTSKTRQNQKQQTKF